METIGRDLREMQWNPLEPSHVAAIKAAGAERVHAAGDMLAVPGEPADRFVYVEEDEVEVVNPFTGKRLVPSTLGPGEYMGDIALLGCGSWSMPMRAATETRVTEVPREAMLPLMADIPKMSDIAITVLAAQRRRAIDAGDGLLVLVGEEVDRGFKKVAEFAARDRIPYRSHALGSPEAAGVASSFGTAPGVPG